MDFGGWRRAATAFGYVLAAIRKYSYNVQLFHAVVPCEEQMCMTRLYKVFRYFDGRARRHLDLPIIALGPECDARPSQYTSYPTT